jgi:hypothetical protein
MSPVPIPFRSGRASARTGRGTRRPIKRRHGNAIPASFTGAAFGQYASFTGGVVFGAQASFEFAAFDSAARFDAADFDAGGSFRGATFGGG